MKTRIVSFFLTILISTGSAVAGMCIAPPSGLVGWWPGDGNANDISDGNNDGSLIDNIGFITGNVDEAFTISGSPPGYVQVPNSSLLESTNVTVDAWVRADGTPGQFRYIVAKGAKDCLAASYGLYTGFGSGLQFYVFDGITTFAVSPAVAAGDVWNGAWHHVAGTYDGKNVRLYLDGIEVGVGTSTDIVIGYSLSTDNDLVIGNYLDNGACPVPTPFSFIGEIDEVELFTVALSADDIGAIYAAGSAGKCKAIQVAIDIKPGSDPNSINLGSAGVIPVAIFSTDTFDATTIDPFSIDLNGATVKIVGNKNLKPLCNAEDVDGDGLVDLACKVYTVDFIVELGESVAELHGMTLDGREIIGQDFIRIVP
jgi:hypothetical protein